jgi:hypothetical protein
MPSAKYFNIQRLTLKPFVISKDGDEYEEEEITKIKNKLENPFHQRREIENHAIDISIY